MNNLFRYEKDLVESFEKQCPLNEHDLLISEMGIRWGNIDLVKISNSSIPFTKQQCHILKKPSCAKIFMRLKNKRLLSKKKLFIGLGLSESTFNKALSELMKAGLVAQNDNNFHRNVNFVFPKVVITGYEAKLTDYNKALYQARMNREYVDYSYMIFPMNIAHNIMEKHSEVLKQYNLGLIGVSQDKIKFYIKPHKNAPMKPYIRLMNLALSNETIYKNEAAS